MMNTHKYYFLSGVLNIRVCKENKFIKYIINPFEQYNNWVGLDDRLKSDKQLHELLESYKSVKSIKKRRSMRKLLFAEMETRF